MKKCLVYLFLLFMSVIFVGCAEQTKVVRLTEKQILEHENCIRPSQRPVIIREIINRQ